MMLAFSCSKYSWSQATADSVVYPSSRTSDLELSGSVQALRAVERLSQRPIVASLFGRHVSKLIETGRVCSLTDLGLEDRLQNEPRSHDEAT
jgi:hypothetical protein